MLPHYPALIATAYLHRFSTAQQLRGFFPQEMASYRTANYQLSQLSYHGFLARVPIRAVMPTSPYVYIASGKGLSLVAEAYERKTGRRLRVGGGEQRRPARGYGLQFMSHELAVTDVDLAIRQLAERRQDITLARTERRYYQSEKCLRVGESMASAVIPDAGYYLLHKVHSGNWLDLCFLEHDNGTMRPRLIREKLHRYDRWANSELGQQYLTAVYRQFGDSQTTKPNFRLLMVVRNRFGEGDDRRRLVSLLGNALQLSPLMRNRLWMTTAQSLFTPGDLQGRIWLRVRDVAVGLQRSSMFAEEVRNSDEEPTKQSGLRATALRDLRLYTLLPPPTRLAEPDD